MRTLVITSHIIDIADFSVSIPYHWIFSEVSRRRLSAEAIKIQAK